MWLGFTNILPVVPGEDQKCLNVILFLYSRKNARPKNTHEFCARLISFRNKLILVLHLYANTRFAMENVTIIVY